MSESDEIEVVANSGPSWGRKRLVVIAASLVSVALVVVGIVGLADGDESESVTAATDSSVTTTTQRPAASTSSSSTSTTSTTTSTTTTITTAPPAPQTAPPTQPRPPGVYISLVSDSNIPGCSEAQAACYWIVGSFVGLSGSHNVQCSINGIYAQGAIIDDPAGWGPGICSVAGGYNLDIVVYLGSGENLQSNIIHLP